jgi:paraquat-inducible protein A
MLDVLLVAILLAVLKLGDMVEVSVGPGLLAFTSCVGLSLIAAASFDPHSLWEPQP